MTLGSNWRSPEKGSGMVFFFFFNIDVATVYNLWYMDVYIDAYIDLNIGVYWFWLYMYILG